MLRRAGFLPLVWLAICPLLLALTTGCTDTKDMVPQVPPPLQITTTTLPSGVVGQAYGPVFLTASNGTPPYTWSEVGSNLSTDGLSLTVHGVITGTPTQPGFCNFTAQVTDSSSPAQSAREVLTITTITDDEPFVKTWGGTESEGIRGIAVGTDGHIYCAGYTYSFGAGGDDALLLRYDSAGTLRWAKTWGGIDPDISNGVAIDSSDNIYCVGHTESYGAGAYDTLLLMYDSSGSLQWVRTWGETDYEYLEGIAVDSSGNIYCAGFTNSFSARSDTLILRYDSSGLLQWAKTWGGTGGDWIYGVGVDSDGYIYCTGFTESFGVGREDALLLKYDSSGTLQWARTWSGTGKARPYGIAVDSGGNIYCAGITYSIGDWNTLLLKYDSTGALQWARTWGGASYDRISSLAVDSGGNIYCAGKTSSFGTGSKNPLLVKYDSTGALQWARTWDSIGDEMRGVTVDLRDNVYLGGNTLSYTGVWQTVTTGIESTPSGTEGTPSGSESTPTGIEGSPVGTEGSPTGSETGAGGSDTLLLKNWQ